MWSKMMEQPKYPITNQTVYTTNIECIMPHAFNGYMKCAFTDDHGITAEIDNVVVFDFDASVPTFGAHRDADTGELVVAAASDRNMACDVMGENTRGLTVRCRE